jgi:hypothetical protein
MGLVRWHRHDGQFERLLGKDCVQTIDVINVHALDERAHQTGITIERSDNAKPLSLKPSVTKEGTPQVAYPYQDDVPLAIGSQNPPDGVDEFLAPVADPGMTKMPKMGQILANLGVCEPEPSTQLAAAGRFVTVLEQVLKLAEIEAESTDDSRGNGRRVVSWRVRIRRHATTDQSSPVDSRVLQTMSPKLGLTLE